MTTTLKAIEHAGGLVFVDPSDEIKEGDWFIHSSHGVSTIHKARETVGKSIVIGANKESSCWADYSKKIIATYNLDLEGVPKLELEDDVEKKYYKDNSKGWDKQTHDQFGSFLEVDAKIYALGYKAAQSKKYTEEELRKAFHTGRLYQGREGDTNVEQFIQSLQPKIESVEVDKDLKVLKINYAK